MKATTNHLGGNAYLDQEEIARKLTRARIESTFLGLFFGIFLTLVIASAIYL